MGFGSGFRSPTRCVTRATPSAFFRTCRCELQVAQLGEDLWALRHASCSGGRGGQRGWTSVAGAEVQETSSALLTFIGGSLPEGKSIVAFASVGGDERSVQASNSAISKPRFKDRCKWTATRFTEDALRVSCADPLRGLRNRSDIEERAFSRMRRLSEIPHSAYRACGCHL